MPRARIDGMEFEYRSYIHNVFTPKPNQITAGAVQHLESFITECNMEETKDKNLTKKQNQIMALIAMGKDKKEIAEILKIEQSTLASHLREIYLNYGLMGDFKNSKALVTYLKNTGRL
jgi:DNA-binding NarL/FixJ family response regulator